jgi:hypothetical protein
MSHFFEEVLLRSKFKSNKVYDYRSAEDKIRDAILSSAELGDFQYETDFVFSDYASADLKRLFIEEGFRVQRYFDHDCFEPKYQLVFYW